MKELSNLFIRAVNYKRAILQKHVSVSRQMLERDFSEADACEAPQAVANETSEIESSAMLLIARAWLRSKLTYLQVSSPLWVEICRLIQVHIPLDCADHESDSYADSDSDTEANKASPELRALATGIYRHVGTYGSSLSLDLELRTQQDLLRELKETNNNNNGESDRDEATEKLVFEFDDVIDDAFDYDRLRSRPPAASWCRRLLSGEHADSELDNLVPLADQQRVEQWLGEFLDSALLKRIDASQAALARAKLGSANESSQKCSPIVDLRDVEKARQALLRAMGLPCDDPGCESD